MDIKVTEKERTVPLCISVDEAAEMLGIGRSTAYEAARSGRLPVVRWGRGLRVVRAGVEAMLTEATRSAIEKREGQ